MVCVTQEIDGMQEKLSQTVVEGLEKICTEKRKFDGSNKGTASFV